MKENFTNAQSDPLVEAATKILTGQINENKKITSEKSQFGGFRPKIVNDDGSLFFLGSAAFKTSQGAEKAAQYYLDQYKRGVNVLNIKMMKGDYVKESELQEMTKTAKDIKKGDSFKANLKIPGKGVNIAREYSVVATDDAMDSKTHPGQRVSIHVKTGNYTTVVSYDKNHKLNLSEETIEEASNDLGTAIIVSPGHKYHGKAVRVFHKFDDGRINVQYKKSDKRGDVINLTLNKGQYKLDESTIDEAKFDVKKLVDDAAALRRKNPQLRHGQSIMITLHKMNKDLYDMAVEKADAFYKDSNVEKLLRLLGDELDEETAEQYGSEMFRRQNRSERRKLYYALNTLKELVNNRNDIMVKTFKEKPDLENKESFEKIHNHIKEINKIWEKIGDGDFIDLHMM